MFNVAGPGMKGMVGMASRVFEVMSNANISISLITQSSSEYSISFCIHSKDAERAQDLLEDSFALELQNNLVGPHRGSPRSGYCHPGRRRDASV